MSHYPTQWKIIPEARPIAALTVLGECDCLNRTRPHGRGWFLLYQQRAIIQGTGTWRGQVEMISNAGPGIIGAIKIVDCCRPDELDSDWAVGPWCLSVGDRRVFRAAIAIPPKNKTWALPAEYVDVVDAAIDSSMDVKEARRAYERHIRETTTEGKYCPACGGVDAHQFNCPVLKRIKNGPPTFGVGPRK